VIRVLRVAGLIARVAAAGSAGSRLVMAARRHLPVGAAEATAELPSISVVVPARDEEQRIGPLLVSIAGAPGVGEVLVVDDRSTDGTAALAGAAGATVVAGRPLSAGWAGKAWALEQGLRAATGEWVVTLDADTRPSPELPRALVARAISDGLDVLTVAGRFDCPTAPLRWLHPAMLTTLVYRAAPPGAGADVPVDRRMGNGQCMAMRRTTLLDAGGFGAVAHHTVEDVALVRTMAAAGFAVGFLDASALLTVRMYDSAADAWRGWGRSLSLPGVESRARQVAGLAVVALAQALPLIRLAARRADALDAVLLLARVGVLTGTATSYTRRGLAYWLSPAADGVAAAALAVGTVRRRHRWRGRAYGPSGTATR